MTQICCVLPWFWLDQGSSASDSSRVSRGFLVIELWIFQWSYRHQIMPQTRRDMYLMCQKIPTLCNEWHIFLDRGPRQKLYFSPTSHYIIWREVSSKRRRVKLHAIKFSDPWVHYWPGSGPGNIVNFQNQESSNYLITFRARIGLIKNL